MNPLRELAANALAGPRLQAKYYALATGVGLAGVAIGLVFFWLLLNAVIQAFGITLDTPVPFSSPVTPWMLFAFFVGFPVGVYLGCALIAGLAGAVLVHLGQLSVSEAVWFALLSRYPSRWMKGKR